MPRPPRETPIERIFREILRQKMPLAIRDIVLRKPIVQPKQSRLAWLIHQWAES